MSYCMDVTKWESNNLSAVMGKTTGEARGGRAKTTSRKYRQST